MESCPQNEKGEVYEKSPVRLYGGTMNANGGTVYGYVLLQSGSEITSTSDSATAFYTDETDATANSVKSDSGATISAGNFYGKVQNLGTITGGVFSGTVDNQYSSDTHCGKVSGGDFSEATLLKNVFKVTFELNGGMISDESTIALQYRAYATVTKPSSTPTQSGFYFIGWYNGDTAWSFGTNGVNRDITLTAKWGTTQRATVVKDPEAITGLVYNGTAQALITAENVKETDRETIKDTLDTVQQAVKTGDEAMLLLYLALALSAAAALACAAKKTE